MAGALPPRPSKNYYDRPHKQSLRRPVEYGQYTSLAFTETLVEAGITGSIGSVGDALDNALMESTIGLFKTEVIDFENATWTSWREVEQATASWVSWYNNERLHSSIGDMPPAEFEELDYALTQHSDQPVAA